MLLSNASEKKPNLMLSVSQERTGPVINFALLAPEISASSS